MRGTSLNDRDTYWASKPTSDIGDEIIRKVDDYQEFLLLSGRLNMLQKSYGQYYNAIRTWGEIQRGGNTGEFSLLSVNDYRNILLHIISITASDRLAMDPMAENSDAESVAQCTLAQGLLDYYMREKRVEKKVKKSLETCLWASDSFVSLSWDIGKGDDVGIGEDGNPIKAGDIVVKNYGPTSCVRDYSLMDSAGETWKILIDLENRFELMARHPELADRIKNVSMNYDLWQYLFFLNGSFMENDELIPVYELRHERTDAVPSGRIVRIIQGDVVLLDSPLPYKKIHVYRMAPADQDGTIFGYSVSNDMLPIQQAMDSINSIILSNIATFGVQSVLIPQGSSLTQDDLANGMKLISYNHLLGKPEALQLTATAPETYNFLNILGASNERLSAINQVTRGNPEGIPGAKSGAALALIQSMAIQFNNTLQQSYVELAEDVGTGIIEILQTFVSQPRVAQITGKSKRSLLKYWTSEDLSTIRRVSVNVGNPMMRTVAGRQNFAEQLLQIPGLISDPAQLLEVYNTGKLEPMTESPLAELQLIRDENESLMMGVDTPAIITDDHDKHILEHPVVVASVEARKNPQVLQATLNHIQQHIDLKGQQSPILQALYGQLPTPQGMPPQGPQGAPPQGPPPELPEQDNGENPGARMPTNPLTGQKFDTVTGGGVVGMPS
jgi:hypothetical protein